MRTNQPFRNLFLVGPMGAGKSSVGPILADRLGMAFHDLDTNIEQRTGVPISEIFRVEGESGFRRRESQALSEFADMEGVVLATGGGCVLDADNRQQLTSRGLAVYLRTPVALQIERLANDRRRPLLQVPDREARIKALDRERDPLYRETAALVIAVDASSPAAMAGRILEMLDKRTATQGNGDPHS